MALTAVEAAAVEVAAPAVPFMSMLLISMATAALTPMAVREDCLQR
jgi:hypothetical protein